jgi:mucin-19
MLNGNIYVADACNHRIRKITLPLSFPGPLPVCDSTWHHIALTYTGSSSTNILTAYLDGENFASTTSASFDISSSSTSSLRLGWNGLTPTSTSGELFTGSMSDLRIYSRSLTSSEIVTLSRPRPQPFSVGAIESSITPNTWYCGPGFSGTSTVSLTRSSSDGTWSSSGSVNCQVCPANSYSFGSSSSCSSCPSGSTTFVSSSLGCRPSSSTSSSPIDTSFYLSGSQSESISAFTSIVNSNGLTYYSSSSSFPNAALVVSSGSYLSTPLLSSLPTGSSPFTVSSWVKCDASSLTESNPSNVVISWGIGQMSTTSTGSLTSATLAVTSRERTVATVSTLAGSGTNGFADGIGTNAQFYRTWGVAVDLENNVYVGDQLNHRIRKITPSGSVSTFAGSGISGYVDSIGSNARFNSPMGLAVDSSGNLFVTDYSNNRIRKIISSGTVTTVAGNGVSGFLDGTGTNSMFSAPIGITVDTLGNLYVADRDNHRIRKIAPSGLVSTLAGSGAKSFADGAGTIAMFNMPHGVTADVNGNVFVGDSDNNRIRMITPTGVVTTVAGSGSKSFADGIGTNADFDGPAGITVDPLGNLYVADWGNNRIRKILSSRVVVTIVGSGTGGFADGIGTTAIFHNPTLIGLGPDGSVYVADFFNHRIRKIKFSPFLPVCDSTWHHIALSYSGSSSTNTLSAYIDGMNIATSTTTTFVISTSSSSSTSSLRLGWNGLTPTSTSGELFTGSMSDLRIYNRSLTSSEIVTLSQPYLTTYTNAINPSPIASSILYTWYCSSGSYGPTITLTRSSSDGTWSSSGSVNCQSCPTNSYSYSGASSCSSCPSGSTTFVSSSLGCRPSSSSSSSPIDTSFYLSGSQSESISAFTSIVNSNGLSYYSSSSSFPNAALVVTSVSYLSTPLLSSLPTGSSPFTVSSWVKCDASSLTDANPSNVVISWGIGQLSTTSTGSLTSATLSVTSKERVNMIATVSTFAGSIQGNTNGIRAEAKFNLPIGIAVDAFGNVYIADADNHCIRKITFNGDVSTFAGSTQGYADGSGTNAKFFWPVGIAVDSSGYVYVADTSNHCIRKITPSGFVSTLTCSFNLPYGVAVDATGNVYVADTVNHKIRKISSSGVVTNLAGSSQGFADGTGTHAKFFNPYKVAVDGLGNVFVTDLVNHRIRKITPSGDVSTFAGSTQGFADGTGTNAKFFNPYGVAVDAAGNVFITDLGNNRIRKITSSGVVTTLAGSTQGSTDSSGTDAKFFYPRGIALDTEGNIFVADSSNHRIRKITFSPSLPGPLPVCDSTWHHIALTYSGSSSTNTLTAFIDGVNIATSTTTTFDISTSSSITSSLRLGWNGLTPTSTSGELFTGSMSDLRIYSRSLTSSEIVTLSQPYLTTYTNAINPSPIASSTLYTWYCSSGSYGPTITLTRSSSDGTWSSSGSVNCQSCPTNSYSYSGASSCSSCPSSSTTFVSSSLGCRPSSTSSSSPIDTSFYLSGSQSESISAFTSIVNSNGLTYYSSSSSFPNAALVVTSGSYLSTPLLSSLPTGSSPFTVSSWVKCDASSLTDANPLDVVISLGIGQMSTTSTGSLTSATLAVTSKERLPSPTVTVSTLAGSGTAGYADGIGTNAMFSSYMQSLTVDAFGNVYVADCAGQRIRKITSSGVVTTLAGSDTAGFADGTGTNAQFHCPAGITIDSANVVFVTEGASHRIRKITQSGLVSVVAGSGTAGYADGTGTNAMFIAPLGIAVDTSGNLFVAEEGGNRIRKITSSGVVTTFAGSGSAGFGNGIGTNAQFNSPRFIAMDASLNIYVADCHNHLIRKISSSGVVTTFAGSTQGFADGTGTNARFYNAEGVTVDVFGTVYVADRSSRIRQITPSGVVTTLAGDGTQNFADGIGTNAKFYVPIGIAVDSSGTLIVADVYNRRIRKITFSPSLPGPLPVCDSTWHHIALTYSGSSSTNTLTAFIDGVNIATSTTTTFDISTSSSFTSSLRLGWNGLTPTSTSGELFTGSMSDLRIYSRSLTSSEIVTLSQPYLTTYTNAINPSPIASSILYTWYCSSGSYGPTITLTRSSSDGTWSSSGSVNCLSCPANSYSYSGASSCSSCPTGSSTFVSSSLGCRPSSSTSSSPIDTSFYLSGSQSESISAFTSIVNSNGLTYYSSSSSFPNAALVVTSGSYLSTPLLSSLPTGSSPFTVSSWVKCDASSLTDANPSNVVISWGIGQLSTTSTGSLTSAILAVTSAGRLLSPIVTVSTLAGSGASGNADNIGTNAMLSNPRGLAVDSLGNILIADVSNHRIRKITPLGVVSTLAGSGPGFVDATGTNSKFNNPLGVAVDSLGNIYVADENNHCIRKIDQTGIVTTLAGNGASGFADGSGTSASFRSPTGVVVDSLGNVFVADEWNHRIRKVTPAGLVTTFAGSGNAGFADGVGNVAQFWSPVSISIDNLGALYVADYRNHRIRKITTSGHVSTYAGSGSEGYADGIGINAIFKNPIGVTVDKYGTLYVADQQNHCIRKITLSQIVSTIVGSGGAPGMIDGLGSISRFNHPAGVATDESGTLFVADQTNHRIRKITISPSLPGPLPVCDSTWHHIALTYSGSSSTNTLTAFIDGVNIATSTTTTFDISTSSSITSSLRLGWNGLTPTSTSGELFTGSMSDLRIYSRSLTSSEIVTLSQPYLTTYTNAINPSPIASSILYTWYCSSGSYGPTITLTRSSSDGTWSSSGSVNCLSCPANSYSYLGASSCSSCPTGSSTFVSSSLGCRPSSSTSSSPIDTSFYLSGSQSESISAFSTITSPLGITYSTSPFGSVNGSLSLASGSYISTPGNALSPTLPSDGNVAWTVSAWVKCAASMTSTWAAVLKWGATGDDQGILSSTSAFLAVGPVGGSSVSPYIPSCDSTWHHVALTYSPEPSLLMFIDEIRAVLLPHIVFSHGVQFFLLDPSVL